MKESESRSAKDALTVVLDCDQGRVMGCQSFCCALIVRLRDGERDPTVPDDSRKSCVDKSLDTGRCIHQDLDSGRCRIWSERPQTCKEYDCNLDNNLQAVLQFGFRSIMQIATATCGDAPKRFVPYVERKRA